jgi:hypothetical protein
MIIKENTRKLATILLITAILVPYLAIGFMPTNVQAQDGGKIVFDYSHGQFNDAVYGNASYPAADYWLKENLTDMGYEVVEAFNGLNDSVLSDAQGLILGGMYGETNGFLASEVEAVANWFNGGNKFLWVGSDSDFGGASYISTNMSWILEEVGSHVYPEPTSVEDPESNCDASYRVVANVTSDHQNVTELVAGTDKVLMHGPTTLYGSTSAASDQGTVALEDTEIENVWPVLYYSPAAIVTDADLVPPVAHESGDEGSHIAMTVEVYAGQRESGIIAVSGASPYGDYRPMYASSYKNVTLSGYNVVKKTIDWGMETAPTFENVSPGIDWLLVGGIIGVIAVVIIILAIVMKRR